MPEKPEQPPEGRLIEDALGGMRPHMTQKEAARLAGISDARWRQLVSGYISVGQGNYAQVTARAETLARMAAAVNVTPQQLADVQREDAAAVLLRLNREQVDRDRRSVPVGTGIDPVELASLTPEEIEAVKAVIRAMRSGRGEE